MSWYTTGTVNLTNSSKTVTGVGTKWTNPLIGVCVGQMLILKTANTIEIYEIASVQSDTQLTIANQYSGASQTGVSYEIPTSPNVSIENLALRVSEMLNYYQLQMEGWQSILTGTGDITLTAPDGRVVTIKSQKALTESINNSVKVGSEFPYRGYLGTTNISSLGAIQKGIYCQNLGENALLTRGYPITDAGSLVVYPTLAVGDQGCVQTYTTYKGARQFIRNYIGDAKNGYWEPWVEHITTTNINHFVPIGDHRLMPFRTNELPFGWYFRNGDNYLLSSPQGQVLNSLSTNYKTDHRITIKTIVGKQYINVPNAFHTDGRGLFERPVNGVTRQVGSIENDTIRNITGRFPNGGSKAILGHENITTGDKDGAIGISDSADDYLQGGYTRRIRWAFFDFDASRVVPTGSENTVINEGKTPAIYLGV